MPLFSSPASNSPARAGPNCARAAGTREGPVDDPSEVSELILYFSKAVRSCFELCCIMEDVGTAYVRNLLHNVADQVRMPAYQSLGNVAAACSSSCQFFTLSLGSARAASWNKDRFRTSVGMATGRAPTSCSCIRVGRERYFKCGSASTLSCTMRGGEYRPRWRWSHVGYCRSLYGSLCIGWAAMHCVPSWELGW